MQVGYGKNLQSCQLGIPTLLAWEVQIWGGMLFVDQMVYLTGKVLHFSPWQSYGLLQHLPWLKTRGSIAPTHFVLVMEALKMTSVLVNNSFLNKFL